MDGIVLSVGGMHADLFAVGKKGKKGHKDRLVMTDAFSQLIELVPIPEKDAKAVQAVVNTLICRFACPGQIVSDQGRELADELYYIMEVQQLCMSAYCPQTNYSAKSFTCELIKSMCMHPPQ